MSKEIEQAAKEYRKNFAKSESEHAVEDFIAGATSLAAKEYWMQELRVKEMKEEISILMNKYEYKSIKGGQ